MLTKFLGITAPGSNKSVIIQDLVQRSVVYESLADSGNVVSGGASNCSMWLLGIAKQLAGITISSASCFTLVPCSSQFLAGQCMIVPGLCTRESS